MKTTSILILPSFIAALALCASTASAAVIVAETGAFVTDTDADSYTVTASDLGDLDGNSTNFTAAGADKLAVVITQKSGQGVTNGITPTVSYNSVELSLGLSDYASGGNGDAFAGIWYLDNVLSAGDLVIDWGGTTVSGVGVGVAALNGTASGIADTDNTSPNSATLDIATDGAFVIGGAVNIGGQPVPFSSGTEYFDSSMFTKGFVAASYWSGIDTADSPFTVNAGGNANVTVAAAFEAVPEPSSFALLAGCFSFLWVMVRRRG